MEVLAKCKNTKKTVKTKMVVTITCTKYKAGQSKPYTVVKGVEEIARD